MNHTFKNMRKQAGFTLVEIAIVLVIIGLLLGGVLKGQEMIENARVKAVVGDLNGVAAAFNSYVDRYKVQPGDESAAAMDARGWGGLGVGGTANGVLGIAPGQTFTNVVASEQPALWRALRASGLASGDPAAAAGTPGLPRAGTGGFVGVGVGIYGQPGPSVCVSGLSTKQAASVDVAVDGPLPDTQIGNNTGSARGATGAGTVNPIAAAPGPVAYQEVTTLTPWTMCRKM